MDFDFLNAELARIATRYNATPQPELLGLSPDQVEALFVGDWRTIGAVRLAAGLNREQVSRGWFFPAALELLRLVSEHRIAPVTATGNLSRKFVAEALERLTFPPGELEAMRQFNKVINEPDAWHLLRLRETLVDAGWLRRRKGFLVSSAGRAALAAAASEPGPSFRWLFLAAVGITGRFLEGEGIPFQTGVGPALYLLRREAREWAEGSYLSHCLLIPSLFRDCPPAQLTWMAYDFVLHPATDFGLLEKQPGPTLLEPTLYRVTPLFGEFVSFRFPNDRGRMWQQARSN
ncbi:MAG: hypothetical protein KF785_05735 [Gemmatimonadales bacterium]|nr:hypothetical protein [Gemmatimonadales bacterium]